MSVSDITDADVFKVVKELEDKKLVKRVMVNQVAHWELSPEGEKLRDELLTFMAIICLGLLAVWLFLRVVKMAFKMAIVAVVVVLAYFVIMFFKGLFGG